MKSLPDLALSKAHEKSAPTALKKKNFAKLSTCKRFDGQKTLEKVYSFSAKEELVENSKSSRKVKDEMVKNTLLQEIFISFWKSMVVGLCIKYKKFPKYICAKLSTESESESESESSP